MDLDAQLRIYAQGIVENIQREYERQITLWEKHVNAVADAHSRGSDAVKAGLQKIVLKMEQEAAEREQFMSLFNQCAMIAFALVGGAAVSWVTGMIEIKLYPKMFSRVKLMKGGEWVPDIPGGSLAPEGRLVFKTTPIVEISYNAVAAKIFGETAGRATGMALDPLFARLLPKPTTTRTPNPKLSHSFSAADVGSLKSGLQATFLDEKMRVLAKLGLMGASINQCEEFGQEVVKSLHYPANAKIDDKQKLADGKRALDRHFDSLRQQWATDYFYFGNNPAVFNFETLAFRFELEIWALWILGQEWKKAFLPGTDEPQAQVAYYVGDSGLELNSIAWALEDRRVAETLTMLKAGTFQAREATLMTGISRTKSTFDDEGEQMLKNLMTWANSHPGKLPPGYMESMRRNVGTVSEPTTIFGGN